MEGNERECIAHRRWQTKVITTSATHTIFGPEGVNSALVLEVLCGALEHEGMAIIGMLPYLPSCECIIRYLMRYGCCIWGIEGGGATVNVRCV